MSQQTTQIPYGILLTALVLLSASGLIASDINLPGMGVAAIALDSPISAIQRTFGIYLIGLAVAQVIYGPLSDAYGRRTLVLGGLFLFTAASITCATAQNVTVFAIGRLLQALGAGAGVVIGRAIVADIFDKKTAGRVFATIMPIVGASPALSPIIGGYLTLHFSWRAPFLFTAALGIATLILVATKIPETFPKYQRHHALLATIKNYPGLLINTLFLAYTVNLGVAYAAYFGYLAASPVIFSAMGMTPAVISYCYISVAVSYIVGNLISRNLIQKYSINHLIAVGYVLFTIGASSLFLCSLYNTTSPLPVLINMAIMTLGNGFLMPLSYAGGITNFPKSAGAASGLMGALQLACGSLAIYVVTLLGSDLQHLGLFMIATALIGCAFFPCLLYFYHVKTRAVRKEFLPKTN
ncbi:multidrug effflux MFS transporter [Pseudomonas sp. PDM24]|uniref:multidrug effflux MFS transporter n=1 Tax=Pseudomonas sp. PDM24 TaxID=2854777 RepID=UPI001C468315|nr:multidrug effflux MFS transporter [Pseudomonas sp. PDM24]